MKYVKSSRWNCACPEPWRSAWHCFDLFRGYRAFLSGNCATTICFQIGMARRSLNRIQTMDSVLVIVIIGEWYFWNKKKITHETLFMREWEPSLENPDMTRLQGCDSNQWNYPQAFHNFVTDKAVYFPGIWPYRKLVRTYLVSSPIYLHSPIDKWS